MTNPESQRHALDTQAARSLADAVAEHAETIGRQHDDRPEVLLARTGLGGQDPITGMEAARRLAVSHQRMTQIVQALYRNRDQATPPGGVWGPRIAEAERSGWPEEYTSRGWR